MKYLPLVLALFATPAFADELGQTLVRKVNIRDYEYIRNTGYAKLPSGKFQMCQRVAEVMKEPESDKALGARVMFSSSWNREQYCPPVKK